MVSGRFPGTLPAKLKVKGKVQPRTGHKGPEGEERYRSTLSLTSALDGGARSTPRPSRSTLGKTQCTLHRALGGPQGRSGLVWKISPLLGFDSQTVQAVASSYTDWAIWAPKKGARYAQNKKLRRHSSRHQSDKDMLFPSPKIYRQPIFHSLTVTVLTELPLIAPKLWWKWL